MMLLPKSEIDARKERVEDFKRQFKAVSKEYLVNRLAVLQSELSGSHLNNAHTASEYDARTGDEYLAAEEIIKEREPAYQRPSREFLPKHYSWVGREGGAKHKKHLVRRSYKEKIIPEHVEAINTTTM